MRLEVVRIDLNRFVKWLKRCGRMLERQFSLSQTE